MSPKSDKACIIHGCPRKANARGLCKPCYVIAKRVVQEGHATWESLAAAGLVRIRKTDSPFLEAFKRHKNNEKAMPDP